MEFSTLKVPSPKIARRLWNLKKKEIIGCTVGVLSGISQSNVRLSWSWWCDDDSILQNQDILPLRSAVRLSEFRGLFFLFFNRIFCFCLRTPNIRDCSFILSAVSIMCSRQIRKNLGHEDTRGRIWSLKCSAWAGKYLPQGFLVCLDQPWPCPELCWLPAAEPRPPV